VPAAVRRIHPETSLPFPKAVIGVAYAVDAGKAFVVIKCIGVDDAVVKVIQFVGFRHEEKVRAGTFRAADHGQCVMGIITIVPLAFINEQGGHTHLGLVVYQRTGKVCFRVVCFDVNEGNIRKGPQMFFPDVGNGLHGRVGLLFNGAGFRCGRRVPVAACRFYNQ